VSLVILHCPVRETQCKSILVDSTVRERESTEIQSTVRESTVIESTVRESTVIERGSERETVREGTVIETHGDRETQWERAQC
jgi:hypothetical protein